jgi:hypothetical protein
MPPAVVVAHELRVTISRSPSEPVRSRKSICRNRPVAVSMHPGKVNDGIATHLICSPSQAELTKLAVLASNLSLVNKDRRDDNPDSVDNRPPKPQ